MVLYKLVGHHKLTYLSSCLALEVNFLCVIEDKVHIFIKTLKEKRTCIFTISCWDTVQNFSIFLKNFAFQLKNFSPLTQ